MKYTTSIKFLNAEEISVVCGGSKIFDDDTIFGAALGLMGIAAIVLFKIATGIPKNN